MGEIQPPETQSPPAGGRDAAVRESLPLGSRNPHAERKPALRAPLPGDSERHFRAALDAGTRASSSLSELERSIADLRSGLGVAADANLHLGQELGVLGSVLEVASAQQRRLSERVAQLEQELAAAERERQFLIAQQDEFLAALLDEHEAELGARDAGREMMPTSASSALDSDTLARAEAARAHAEQEAAQARAELAATQAARDEARALASKYGLERDALRAEASRLRASLGVQRPSSNPPAPSAPRPPSFRPAPALRLDQGELATTLHARRSTPLMAAVVPRFTPSQLPAGGVGSDSAPPVASQFPRESTRPGVGGPKPSEPPSAAFGPAPSAWTPAPPAPETVVTRSPWPLSAATLPPEATPPLPALKRKPDPTTRPLIDYSLGEGGVQSETLEGAKLRSSNPPRK